MTRRKSRDIYIPNYFMAVRDCMNILVLYGLKVRLYKPVGISANYVTAGNLNARINSSSYLFYFLEGLYFILFYFLKFNSSLRLLLLLLFLTFSVLVANPKKLLYTVANPARGLLNREKRTKEKVWQHTPPPPLPTLLVRRK